MTLQVGRTSPGDLEKKTRILSLLESRRKTYGSVAVTSVLVRDPAGWKTSLTIFEVLHREDRPTQEATHLYTNFTLARRIISLDDLAGIVEDLVTNGTVKITDLPELAAGEGFFSHLPYYERVSSNDETFKLDWPADSFTYEPKPKAGLPVEPFVSMDGPLYPGGWEVVRLWTGVDVSKYSQLLGSFVFLLPNFEARIEELRLSSGVLTVKVRPKEVAVSGIIGKLYCEKFGDEVVQRDIVFESDSVTIPLHFVPDWWQFYLLSKDGTWIDFRKVHASWSSLPAGVIVELGAADVEQILARGENDHVEFKRDLSGKPDEFLETVVAFANTGGGSIFVGVDNNSTVAGAHEPGLGEKLQNMISEKCEPAVEVTVEQKEYLGKPVYIVRVPEGDQKPYNLKNRGFFTRAGSTDRHMSRIEMDDIYVRRNSPPLGRRLY